MCNRMYKDIVNKMKDGYNVVGSKLIPISEYYLRNFKGIPLYYEILKQKNIRHIDKIILSYIYSRAYNSKVVSIEVNKRKLSVLLNCSMGAIYGSINRLIKQGLLTEESKKNRNDCTTYNIAKSNIINIDYSRFLYISKEILRNKTMQTSEKLVLAYEKSFSKKDMIDNTTNSKLAEILGLSYQVISRCRRSLQYKKLINIDNQKKRFNGTYNSIKLDNHNFVEITKKPIRYISTLIKTYSDLKINDKIDHNNELNIFTKLFKSLNKKMLISVYKYLIKKQGPNDNYSTIVNSYIQGHYKLQYQS